MKNRGQTTLFMAVLIVGILFALIFLLVLGIITLKINDALDRDIDLGQVNLQEYNAQTFGQFKLMFVNNADWWGISIIFGMVIGLFLSSYFLRGKFPKFGIILDIFIIIVVFIVALYVSSSYSAILDALATAGETFLEDYTPKTSNFIINLPIFTVIIGVVMMVLFHSSIPKRTEESIQAGGFLQGVQ